MYNNCALFVSSLSSTCVVVVCYSVILIIFFLCGLIFDAFGFECRSQLIAKDILRGAYDSIKGIAVVWYLDRELNRKLELQKFQKQPSEYDPKSNDKSGSSRKTDLAERGLE